MTTIVNAARAETHRGPSPRTGESPPTGPSADRTSGTDAPSRFALDDLRAFALIAGAGGISAASRRHDEPKASLARALARLEAAAGRALFDRVGRGLRLTEFGEALIESAERAVRLDREIEAVRRAAAAEPCGSLRVATGALLGARLVAPVLAEIARRHPGVESALTVSGAAAPVPLEHELDVVVRIGRPDAPELVSRRVLSTRTGLYCARALAASVDAHDPDAVARLGRIVIDPDGLPEPWTVRAREGGPETVFASEPIIRPGDPAAALELLRGGAGMSLLPDAYAEPFVASGELVRLLPDARGPEIDVHASFAPRRSAIPAVRLFIDLLVAECERVGGPRGRAPESVPRRDAGLRIATACGPRPRTDAADPGAAARARATAPAASLVVPS